MSEKDSLLVMLEAVSAFEADDMVWKRPLSCVVEDGIAWLRDADGYALAFANPEQMWVLLAESANDGHCYEHRQWHGGTCPVCEEEGG